MKWTDIFEIASTLSDVHPHVDPATVRFTQLRDMVLTLPKFSDDPDRCGEKILEAIQQQWLDEARE
jgi:FeS assembly protein IscX